jgi:hypothetical protein
VGYDFLAKPHKKSHTRPNNIGKSDEKSGKNAFSSAIFFLAFRLGVAQKFQVFYVFENFFFTFQITIKGVYKPICSWLLH